MDLPPLPLDGSAGRPLRTQLADGIRSAAVTGALRPGDRLPSTRALAADLGLSRTVCAAAYDQLLAEGWLAGRAGSGTFVVGVPGSSPTAARSAPGSRPATGRRHAGPPAPTLRAGMPCLSALDPSVWRRAWRVAADAPVERAADAEGLPAFRAAVVEHLLRHRGLPCDPALVLATAGSTAALSEIAALLPAGSVIAVENPGYAGGAAALRAAGHALVGVPVDADGLVVAEIPDGVGAVVVTPAHQYPMGSRLTAARRVQLVERARADGLLIIEDDYDGELRYDVAPLPLLAALGPDVVVHLGTASKMLTPGLGCGWLVAPPAVRAGLVERRDATRIRPAAAGQRVFTALAAHGDLARHLRRLRRELAARRSAVVATVRAAGRVPLGDAAGAHVVVEGPDERAGITAAAVRGLDLDGLARHHLTGPAPARQGLVLGYAGPEPAELTAALTVLADLL
ncbi:PLP-dependent aminotransferase family protein [Nakamurella sp.]|uniref:MocR-like pyridoxine biosynthesis transcription factor PdxR n=1 Tax=Nakamurella sp. TaxID=1869182 RepID=UPI003B3A3F98